jgi:hypothetical protein
MLYSVLIPWFTLREVPVEVEIVSHSLFLARNPPTYGLAIAQSRHYPFRPWDAARSLGQNQPHLDHGVPRFWNHQ